MKPKSFHSKEIKFTSDNDDIDDLPVLKVTYGDLSVGLVSHWKPSLADIVRIIFGSGLYLTVLSYNHPPVSILTRKSEAIGDK